jgi:hypothetical protein
MSMQAGSTATVALAWVDTVLGQAPPLARNGDLATNTATSLAVAAGGPPDSPPIVIAIAKGCVAADDGGGGTFFWDSNPGKDDGGTVIVPGGNVGTIGECWRRVCSRTLDVRWFGARADTFDRVTILQGQNLDDGGGSMLAENQPVMAFGGTNSVSQYFRLEGMSLTRTRAPKKNGGAVDLQQK